MVDDQNRDVAKNSPAYVYVLPQYVNGRDIRPPYDNACRKILEEHYDELPWPVLEKFDAYLQAERKYFESMRLWGQEFITDIRNGLVPKDRSYRPIPDPAQWTTRMIALAAVIQAGAYGVTAYEIKMATGVVSHAIGGGLSDLNKAGLIVRLDLKRATDVTTEA